MEVPSIWRQTKQRLGGPGSVNDQGRNIVNGKVFDPETGKLQSLAEIARLQIITADCASYAVIQVLSQVVE